MRSRNPIPTFEAELMPMTAAAASKAQASQSSMQAARQLFET
jgi:hypothetical protein